MNPSIQDLLACQYAANLNMVRMTLADLTDADLLTRPVPNANHANWQLGHVITSEAMMTGNMAVLPAGFAEKYKRDNARTDDPGVFATKAELLSTLEKVRQSSIQWAQSLTPERMEQASPEMIQHLAPRIIDLALLIPTHMTIHIGQIQVLRRKLGKPVLF